MKLLSFFPFSACLATVLFVSSCNDDIKPINRGNENLTVNEWIINTLEEKYLWNDEVKEKNKNENLSPDKLFPSLLSLKDGKVEDNIHYPYSYIKSKADSRALNTESTYGFEFQVYHFVNDNGSYAGFSYGRVLYVIPESPAQKAGLKRGDWIYYINGQKLTKDNYSNLYNGGAISLGINNLNNPAIIRLEASYKIEENPILLDTILNVGNDKIGYLVYNQFATGPNDDHTDKTYDNQLINIFKNKFYQEGINEFVLDLRYNGGGYLSSATILGGLLVPEQHKNEIFCYTKNNADKYQTYKFADNGYHLNLSRVFVLVSGRTASASEAVINGLLPFIDVILIGDQTEGKNVGSETIEDDKYDWAMHPITVQIYNSEYNSEYSDGFKPEHELNELDYYSGIYFYPLGDIREYYLSRAISIIRGQSSNAKVKNDNEPIPNINYELGPSSLSRKKNNSLIID